jgi:NADP-dependent 3-hydroxy acid dehydrogenase YdfG
MILDLVPTRHPRRCDQGIGQFYEQYAIPAGSFARAVAFAISQPEDVDINEILFRPTRQEV